MTRWEYVFISVICFFTFVFLALLRVLKPRTKSGRFSRWELTGFLFLFLFSGIQSSCAKGQTTNSLLPLPSANPSPRMQKLEARRKWKTFKEFWQKLDRVEPLHQEKDADTIFRDFPYAQSITQEQGEAFSKELHLISSNELQSLVGENLLSMREQQWLVYLCSQRISQMMYYPRSMLTRCLPPPMAAQTDFSVSRLEQRIDQLIRLRQKKRISAEELNAAVLQVQNDAILFSLIQYFKLSWSYRFHFIPVETGATNTTDYIQIQLSAFSNYVRDFREKQASGEYKGEQYDELARDLDIIERGINSERENFLKFGELVGNLIQ